MPATGRRRYLDVADAIGGAISRGHLVRGSRLPSDRELSDRLGVSRPTVREALLILEFCGLIDIRQGSGTYVREDSLQTAVDGSWAAESPQELIQARIAIEPPVARLCAAGLTEIHAQTLLDLIGAAEAHMGPDGDPGEVVRLGLQFHRRIATCCGNSILSDFCCSLVDVTDHPLWMLLNRQAMGTADARRRQVEDHRRVLDAILRRDLEASAEAMRTHLERVSSEVIGLT